MLIGWPYVPIHVKESLAIMENNPCWIVLVEREMYGIVTIRNLKIWASLLHLVFLQAFQRISNHWNKKLSDKLLDGLIVICNQIISVWITRAMVLLATLGLCIMFVFGPGFAIFGVKLITELRASGTRIMAKKWVSWRPEINDYCLQV